jgi:hypothetical protein
MAPHGIPWHPWAAAPGAKGKDLPVTDGVSWDPDRDRMCCFFPFAFSFFGWVIINK